MTVSDEIECKKTHDDSATMKASSPTLEQFEEMTCKAFDAELAGLGFDCPIVTKTPPEIVLVYLRDDCRVSAFYEFGDPPWVKLESRGQNGRWRGRSLDKIVSADLPDITVTRPTSQNITQESVQLLLSEYAVALRSVCGTTSR